MKNMVLLLLTSTPYLGMPIGPPAPLQTEFSRFCVMKYILKKETHNKNEENTLKELNKIFLTAMGCQSNFYLKPMKNEVHPTWAEPPLPKD
jgi:hypothetical protein